MPPKKVPQFGRLFSDFSRLFRNFEYVTPIFDLTRTDGFYGVTNYGSVRKSNDPFIKFYVNCAACTTDSTAYMFKVFAEKYDGCDSTVHGTAIEEDGEEQTSYANIVMEGGQTYFMFNTMDMKHGCTGGAHGIFTFFFLFFFEIF